MQRHPEAGSLRTYASLADSACIQANITAGDPAPDGVYGPAVALGQNFSNARAPCAASSEPLAPDSDLTEPPSLISCGTRTVLGSSTSGPQHSDSQLSEPSTPRLDYSAQPSVRRARGGRAPGRIWLQLACVATLCSGHDHAHRLRICQYTADLGPILEVNAL